MRDEIGEVIGIKRRRSRKWVDGKRKRMLRKREKKFKREKRRIKGFIVEIEGFREEF